MITLKSNKLFKKVLLLFLGIITITVIFSFIGITLQKRSILESLHSEAKSLAQAITFVSADALVINDNSYLIEFNQDYIQHNTKLKNIIISKTDKKYFNIKKKSWSIDQKIDSIYINMQQKKESYEILLSPILNEEVFHYTYPIYLSGLSWGWLHLSFDLKEYNEELATMYLHTFYFLLSLLLITYSISYYIAKVFSTPIIELNKAVTSITYDNFNVKVEINSNDEIGELASAFNTMISKLNISQNKLKTSHEDLEKRVHERTKELEVVNSTLEEKSLELSELNTNLDNKVKGEIEKRRKQEQMLLQQSRLAAMGEMVGNIAHQWRQPLNAIGIIIQNIELSYEMNILNDKFMKKSINDSLDLTNMMSKTIDDFRNFFMPNKKEETFLLSESLDSSLELIGSTFTSYNIHVEKDIDETLIINGFPNEFAQTLLNLLSNAKDVLIENKIENPKVSIVLKRINGRAILRISDNGGGAKENILEKIFEPYFTTKAQGKGTGIGLYMSKIIIEQNMNGKIYAKNLKEGLSFIIEMPLANS
jgi:nitrogen fixation/metabolism regulation signal transduction histidine kinase